MTAPEITFATTGRGGVKQASMLLVDAARRGDLQRVRERRWDVYLLNGRECPDIRLLLSKLLTDGVLVIEHPDADVSLIVPAGGAR